MAYHNFNLEDREYNPKRTKDYFNQPTRIQRKTFEKFKGEIPEKEYSDMLEDYKDRVIADFHKLNDDITKTAITWNCTEQQMIFKLRKWDVIKKIIFNKEMLEKKYYELGTIEETAKFFNLTYEGIRYKLKIFKIALIKKYRNRVFDDIMKDVNLQKKLVDFYLNNGLEKTSDQFKLNDGLTIKVLKLHNVYGDYKRNRKRPKNSYLFGKNLDPRLWYD